MAERIVSDQLVVRLEMRGIRKRFGATVTQDDVGIRSAGC